MHKGAISLLLMLHHHLTTAAAGHLGKDANNKSDSTLTDANRASYIVSPRSNSQSVSPLNTTPNSPQTKGDSGLLARDKPIDNDKSGSLIDFQPLIGNTDTNTNTNTRDNSIITNNDNYNEDGDSDSMIFERNVEDPYFLNNFARGSRSNSTRTSRAASIYRVPTSVSIQSDVSNATSTIAYPPLERHTTLENYVPPILDEMGSLVTDNDTNLEDINMIYNPRRPSSTLGLDMALGRRTSSYSNGDPQPYSPQALSINGSSSNNNNSSNKLLRLHSYADILYNDSPRPNLKPHHASYSEASSPSLLLSHQNSHPHQQHTSSHQNMFIQPGSTVNAIQETNIKNPFMLRHSETSTSYLTSKNSHPLQFKNHQTKNNRNNQNKFHIESSEEGSNDDEIAKSE